MFRKLDREALDLAMTSLAIRLDENRSDPVEVVVCGGSALILTGMIPRTTKDVDVVALVTGEMEAAARWSMTHDVSEGFKMVLKRLLEELGYEDVATRV